MLFKLLVRVYYTPVSTRKSQRLLGIYQYQLSRNLKHGTRTGHQPLSWNARVQIALDAAKGLEYIHDHTKARYVHRDIKTSNILIDEKLRAKVLIN